MSSEIKLHLHVFTLPTVFISAKKHLFLSFWSPTLLARVTQQKYKGLYSRSHRHTRGHFLRNEQTTDTSSLLYWKK